MKLVLLSDNSVIMINENAKTSPFFGSCDFELRVSSSQGLKWIYTVSQKNVLTLKQYSSKLQGAILIKFGRNIYNTPE